MRAGTGDGAESTVDYQIEELIDERVDELNTRIEELEAELEELDNFARISLGERRIKGNEANLSEFSDSLTGFADKTFTKINAIESRLDIQTLLLASVVEALDDVEDIDVDLSDVKRYQEDQLVVSSSPEQRLRDAISEST